MFIYLNFYCPSDILMMYLRIFKTSSTKKIIFALNALKKELPASLKKISQKIFQNSMKRLKLLYHEKIFALENENEDVEVNGNLSLNWMQNMTWNGKRRIQK